MSSTESVSAIGSPGRPLTQQALQKQMAIKKALGEDLTAGEQPGQLNNPAGCEPSSGGQGPLLVWSSDELQPLVPVTPVLREADRVKDLERQLAV